MCSNEAIRSASKHATSLADKMARMNLFICMCNCQSVNLSFIFLSTYVSLIISEDRFSGKVDFVGHVV